VEERALRRALRRWGRRCYARGLVAGTNGNLSVRIPGTGDILITAAGSALGRLRPDDIVRVPINGLVAASATVPVPGAEEAGDVPAGPRPSSELPLHRALYRAFAEIGAVVHTHSPAASAYACAGRSIDLLSREAQVMLRVIPVVPFCQEGTEALAQEVVATLSRAVRQEGLHPAKGGAALLARHGVLTWGPDIAQAYYLAEVVEQVAQLGIYHRILGLFGRRSG